MINNDITLFNILAMYWKKEDFEGMYETNVFDVEDFVYNNIELRLVRSLLSKQVCRQMAFNLFDRSGMDFEKFLEFDTKCKFDQLSQRTKHTIIDMNDTSRSENDKIYRYMTRYDGVKKVL